MKIFILAAVVVLVAGGKGNSGDGKRAQRKQQRKESRQCKNRECSEECASKEYMNRQCYTCLDTAKCPLPKRREFLAITIKSINYTLGT